jgi:hypothetical protein
MPQVCPAHCGQQSVGVAYVWKGGPDFMLMFGSPPLAITARPLRGLQGLRPYATSKALAASRLALGGYPRNNLQRLTEIALLNPHDEIKDVAAHPAAKTEENPSIRFNIKRRMSLRMKGAQAYVLRTPTSKPGTPFHKGDEIARALHFASIKLKDRKRVHRLTTLIARARPSQRPRRFQKSPGLASDPSVPRSVAAPIERRFRTQSPDGTG